MSTFRTSIKLALAHPFYLLIYGVFLSALAVFFTMSVNPFAPGGENEQTYVTSEYRVAVVDRDGSAVSRALADHFAKGDHLVEVADEPVALQDALATNVAHCVVIVPKGFGQELVDAARAGRELPTCDVAYSYQSLLGGLADADATSYLGLIASAATLGPEAPIGDAIAQADEAASHTTEVTVDSNDLAQDASDVFAFYLSWTQYLLSIGLIVFVSLVVAAFNRTDVRRRNDTSPKASLGRSLGLAAGCLVVGTVYWAFVIGVGFAFFGWTLEGVPADRVALAIVPSYVFALVILAAGFLMGQLGIGESTMNAIANIGGLVMAFLGGSFVSLSLLSPEIQTIARFTPSYWGSWAVHLALDAAPGDAAALAETWQSIGIVALFAVALLAVGLAVSRMRMQSATGGGNAAAERSIH